MQATTNPLIDTLEAKAISLAGKTAVVANDFTLTYSGLHQYVKQIAQRFRSLGVVPGQVVVTKLPIALDWIVTLAITHEAAVSHSAAMGRPINPKVKPDWLVLMTDDGDDVDAGKVITIGNDWLASLANESTLIERRNYPSPSSAQRISGTSGTTGEPKAFVATVDALTKITQTIVNHLPTRERAISLVGLTALNTFWGLASKLHRGEPQYVIHIKDGNFFRIFLRDKIELIGGSPKQVEDFIKFFEKYPELATHLKEIRLFGATPSNSLLKTLLTDLKLVTHITYGMTEVGLVSVKQAEIGQDNYLLGKPVEGMSVRVRDSENNSMEGRIEIRPSFEFVGYLGSDEANAAHFQDGWFIPGDIVSLTPEGEIRFIGRKDDVVNTGGEKYSLDRIDSIVAGLGGIVDAASFTVEGADGTEIHLAVVANDVDQEKVRGLLDQELPGVIIQAFHITTSLPRTATGKVQRRLLRSSLGL